MQRYDLQSIVFGISEHTTIRPQNFFEIGSRDGHDAAEIAKIFRIPHTSCHIFEANPEACEFISKTYPQFNLYNNAISDTTGSVSFNLEPENVGASSLLQRVTPCAGMKTVTVDAIRMEDFLEVSGIPFVDCMKLDVEGWTLPVLKGFGKHINRVQCLQMECEHEEVWKGQSLFDECAKWLEDHGFVMEMFTRLRVVQSDSFWVKRDCLLK